MFNLKCKCLIILLAIFYFFGGLAFAENLDKSKYINKTVLITINVTANHDQVIRKKQIAAKIIRLDQNRIVLLPFKSGTEFGLPPDPRFLIKAKKGEYQLENGNVKSIANPDYTVTLNLDKSDSNIQDTIEHGFVPEKK